MTQPEIRLRADTLSTNLSSPPDMAIATARPHGQRMGSSMKQKI